MLRRLDPALRGAMAGPATCDSRAGGQGRVSA